MDSFELNKIAGAALSALLVIFGTKALLDVVYKEPKLEKVAYALPMTAPVAGAADAGGFDFKQIAGLMPKANAEAGQDSFKKCAACHTPEKGGQNRVGPNLWGVVGRPVGVGSFGYSDSMKGKGGTWGWEQLATYLYDPRAAIPGNKMAFAGVKDAADLADILAYLRKLADAPSELPK